jgi:hypothetical protein
MKNLIKMINETETHNFQDENSEVQALQAWENALEDKAEAAKIQELYEMAS